MQTYLFFSAKFLNKSRDEDSEQKAENWVVEVGIDQETGGEVGADELEGRLEDSQGADEEIKAAHHKEDKSGNFEFCVHNDKCVDISINIVSVGRLLGPLRRLQLH